MQIENNFAKDVRITYIGGGSRGWAWTLMRDLMLAENLSGTVCLYDIDIQAAKNNETIGNRLNREHWKFETAETIGEALNGADFVIVSILPGTFDEMESDVHAPEKYGIYQSVGDTTGAGGVIRSMRTIPMFREIARAIRKHCPDAWVINYTNPMAVCVETLYREFPEIKAFGCCHEVFGTQELLSTALDDICGIHDVSKEDIIVNVVGVNHFTWFTSARYKNIDLFDVFRQFSDKYYDKGYTKGLSGNWVGTSDTGAKVRFDLFRRFGYIAAAGDRHLAEFMDPKEYLDSPECVRKWLFTLTSVAWRKHDLEKRLAKSQAYLDGSREFEIIKTKEEGVQLMQALLGLSTKITNVNVPNRGQIPNLPMGTVVETNAIFRADSLQPVMAGELPISIYPLIRRIAEENEAIVEAGFSCDKAMAYKAFAMNHALDHITEDEKKELFRTMWENTKTYLTMYH